MVNSAEDINNAIQYLRTVNEGIDTLIKTGGVTERIRLREKGGQLGGESQDLTDANNLLVLDNLKNWKQTISNTITLYTQLKERDLELVGIRDNIASTLQGVGNNTRNALSKMSDDLVTLANSIKASYKELKGSLNNKDEAIAKAHNQNKEYFNQVILNMAELDSKLNGGLLKGLDSINTTLKNYETLVTKLDEVHKVNVKLTKENEILIADLNNTKHLLETAYSDAETELAKHNFALSAQFFNDVYKVNSFQIFKFKKGFQKVEKTFMEFLKDSKKFIDYKKTVIVPHMLLGFVNGQYKDEVDIQPDVKNGRAQLVEFYLISNNNSKIYFNDNLDHIAVNSKLKHSLDDPDFITVPKEYAALTTPPLAAIEFLREGLPFDPSKSYVDGIDISIISYDKAYSMIISNKKGELSGTHLKVGDLVIE